MVIHHWQGQNVKVSGVDDMVLLPKISEDAIMDNLRKRYMDDYIYTCIGPVLVSVNPFKQMSYFGEKEVETYQGAAPYENPPHIYGLADEMYRNMLVDVESQCVIISGESGAGKTVAAKYIMAYISRVSGGGERVQRVKDIILKSNPLLEAFGNAKTIRNNNSSRFGKYVEMQFDNGGEPIGGKISNFLLEKSRVVRHNSGERNFHIFYQLIAGANEQMKLELGLRHELNGCDYLSSWNCNTTAMSNHGDSTDARDFQDTLKALSVMSINETQVSNVLRIVAGILHVGNIKFQENGNYSKISDKTALGMSAYLFDISAERLAHKLTSRGFESKWGSESESYDVTLNVTQALYTRDALAKDIYARLFNYLVKRVNWAMEISNDALQIAILDIYGFEIFDKNGFEQFCINFVNEKLQQIFIALTLKAEQEEYVAENIKWTKINYFNNAVVVELLEGKRPPGLFLILDDVCATLHSGSVDADSDLRKQLCSASNNHAHFQSSSDGFAIIHYAGQVVYSVDGFCEKNRDILFPDLIELMQSSTNPLINELYPPDEDIINKTKTLTRNVNRSTTAGSKIRDQANRLINQLMKCMPHYIRCIKPNETKKPRDWDTLRVKHQVEYLGLKENIRVRRAGFAYRRTFAKFLHRYSILLSNTWHISSNAEIDKIKCIMSSVHIDENQYQLGITKVFIKAPESVFMLEEARERRYNFYARIIQQAFRKHFARKRQNKEKQSAADLLYGHKQRRCASLNRHFVGDYIGLDSRPDITKLLGRREKIFFAEVVKKYDRRFKMCRRDLILTRSCLYLIGRAEKIRKKGTRIIMKRNENVNEEIIKRKLTFDQISHVSLSMLQDDFIIVHVKDDYASLLQLIFKTEFLAILNKRFLEELGQSLIIKFSNNLEYKVKKEGWGGGGTRQLKFSQIDYGNQEILKISGKILNISIGPGMPPTSRPKSSLNTFKSSLVQISPHNTINQCANYTNNHSINRIAPTDRFHGNQSVGAISKIHSDRSTQSAQSKLTRQISPTAKNPIHVGTPQMSYHPPLPNRPTLNSTTSQYNRTQINNYKKSAPTNFGNSSHSGWIRPPPPPSHPAPPNQPVIRTAYGMRNPERFIHEVKGNDNNHSNNQQMNVINSHTNKKNRQPPPHTTIPAKTLTLPSFPKVKALYDYSPQDLDELELKEGDIIELLKEHEGGWWHGKLNNKTGLFPSNYVEKILT